MTPVPSIDRWPPLAWILIRLEWRLTMRDFFLLGMRKKRKSALVVTHQPVGRKRRIVMLVLTLVVMHAAGALTLGFPRQWHDTAGTRYAVVAFFAFLFTWMLSFTMSRIVAAFHERRDLDLLLSAPVDPTLVLAVRSLTIVAATTLTFGFFVFPIVDFGVVAGRWWLARLYLFVPLVATIATALALLLTDGVVRLIGVRRARVGLQVFSALIGASVYFVSQARQFLPHEMTARLSGWFVAFTRLEDAPPPTVFLAAVARGDALAWTAMAVVAVGLFTGATWWARRRFVEIAQMPDSVAKVVQPERAVIERRFVEGFARSVFATLLMKEWRLMWRAPQLLSQVLLQLLYLTPLMLVALNPSDSVFAFGPGALAAGVVGIASTLATSLAWLTVAAEDAPDLIAGSPGSRRTILGAKLMAAVLPPVVIVGVAAIATTQRSLVEGIVILLFGILACTSAAILAASSPARGKRSDFQRRNTGRGLSSLVEALQFLLWAAAAGTAGSELWIAAAPLTVAALILPAIRLPRALRQLNAIE